MIIVNCNRCGKEAEDDNYTYLYGIEDGVLCHDCGAKFKGWLKNE